MPTPATDYFDLGELPHGPDAPDRPPRPRRRLTAQQWRTRAVLVVVVGLVAVTAFQVGGQRVRDQVRPTLQTPPVLAWLSAAPPSEVNRQQVVVHVANLTTEPVRVEQVISRPGQSARAVSANLPATVTIGPSTTGTATVDLAAECGGPYVGASIAVQVAYPDPLHDGATQRTVVAVDQDPLVGPAYTTLLNQVCTQPVTFGGIYRVAGVSVEIPKIMDGVVDLVLTSRVHTPRAVQVLTGVGRFQVIGSPKLPFLVTPGAQQVLELRVRVLNCSELALGEEWAQGVRLQLTPVGEDPGQAEDVDDPTSIGLFDVIYPVLDFAQHETCPAEFS